jgi:hypothetical protein
MAMYFVRINSDDTNDMMDTVLLISSASISAQVEPRMNFPNAQGANVAYSIMQATKLYMHCCITKGS